MQNVIQSVDTVAAEEAQDKVRRAAKAKNIMCRICKGEHFTSKCPYKDTLQPLDEIANSIQNVKLEAGKCMDKEGVSDMG